MWGPLFFSTPDPGPSLLLIRGPPTSSSEALFWQDATCGALFSSHLLIRGPLSSSSGFHSWGCAVQQQLSVQLRGQQSHNWAERPLSLLSERERCELLTPMNLIIISGPLSPPHPTTHSRRGCGRAALDYAGRRRAGLHPKSRGKRVSI